MSSINNQNSVNIVLCFDANYAKHFVVLFKSIRENYKGKLNIYIFTKDINNKNIILKNILKDKKTETHVQVFPFKKILLRAVGNEQPHVIECYYRILLAKIIPLSVKKIIYLDADTLVRGNIENLFNTKIKTTIGGVNDHCCGKYAREYIKNDIGINIKKYINAGVLLINLQKWRQKINESKILEFLQKNNKHMRLLDQDLINIIFQDEITLINGSWNQFYPLSEEQAQIHHMVGRWKGNSMLNGSLIVKTAYNSYSKQHSKFFIVISHFLLGKPLNIFINIKHKIRYKYKKITAVDLIGLILFFYPPIFYISTKGFIREFKKKGIKKTLKLIQEFI